jgi:hypothetical protein
MSHQQQHRETFRRTAISLPILVVAAVLLTLFILGTLIDPSLTTHLSIAGVVVLVLTLLFFRLSVTVTDQVIVIKYGIGIIQRYMDVHAITDLEVLPNRSLQALYNIGAENILVVSDRSGTRASVGLFDPRELLVFLRARIRG